MNQFMSCCADSRVKCIQICETREVENALKLFTTEYSKVCEILAGEAYRRDPYHSSSIAGASPYYNIILIQNKYLMLVLTKKICSSNNNLCVFRAQ